MTVFRFVDDTRERGVRAAVLRIGFRPQRSGAAHRPLVIQFVIVAAGIGRHHRPVAAAPCQDRGFAELVVGAAVGGADEAADGLAAFEEIGRVGSDEADRTRQAVAAVERRRGTAQNLDRLDEAEVDIVAAARSLRAEGEAIGDADAVDLDQHAVAADAADVEAVVPGAAGRAERGAEARGLALDANARFEADEVADVGDHLVGDLLVGLDGDRRGNLLGPGRDACRGDDDLRLAREPIFAVIVLRKGRLRERGERKAQRAAGGKAGGGRRAMVRQNSSPARLRVIRNSDALRATRAGVKCI